MAEIDPSLPIPLFYQLKNLVFEDIVSGKCGPGDRLPTEHELCERYGISRTPIHRALSELADEGVIIRTRRKGSFVSPHWVPTRAVGDELRVTVTQEALVEPITTSAAAPHRVNIAVTDYAELRHTLLGAIAEGRAPDVALIDETLIADFAEAGFLLPLDDIDPGWFKDEFRDDFVEPFVTGRMYEGSVYAVPEEVNVAGLWCSREALDSVGAQVPTTWAELEATARSIQEEQPLDVRAFAMPGGHVGGETTTYCLLAVLASNGVEIIDDAVRLASPPAIDALQMLRRFIDGGAMSGDVVTHDWLRCPGLLGAKKVAMTVGGTYEADVIAAAAGIGLDEVYEHFAFAPFPAGPVGSAATVAGGMVYVVFRQTRYPKEALELLERIIATDRLIDRARGHATIPPRHSAIELIDTGISAMAALEADYSAITPPPAWSELHERQLQILADAIDLYSRMAVALEDPTEILELFEELLDFAARTPELSAKVSSKLADYFDGLA